MAKYISAKMLNDDKQLWLKIPHENHNALGDLMEMTYPGFREGLIAEGIECLLCSCGNNAQFLNIDLKYERRGDFPVGRRESR